MLKLADYQTPTPTPPTTQTPPDNMITMCLLAIAGDTKCHPFNVIMVKVPLKYEGDMPLLH
jgi:hypothetical protein